MVLMALLTECQSLKLLSLINIDRDVIPDPWIGITDKNFSSWKEAGTQFYNQHFARYGSGCLFDLKPDFIPALWYLDDIILLPMFVVLTVKLVPDEVLENVAIRRREYGKTENLKDGINSNCFGLALYNTADFECDFIGI